MKKFAEEKKKINFDMAFLIFNGFDFLVKTGRKDVKLIQVADNLNNDKTRRREIDSLVKAMEELKLKSGLILTDDTEEDLQITGKSIKVMPLYKWLLGEE